MPSTIRTLLGLAAALFALASCADRPGAITLNPVQPASVGTPVSVLIATTRDRSATDAAHFTDGRSDKINYEHYTVSFPPTHKMGGIEWPQELPGNPATDTVVTSAQTLDQSSFDAELTRDPNLRKSGDVLVFVHGYNTNYQEAVFRVAQLTRDNAFPGTMIGFAWPSRGTLTGYVADRESTTYSRDYLETFLNNLAHVPGVKHINLVAHSMGNWLAVETLRQAKMRGNSPFVAKLGEVFLMSPDIDVDVFRTQIAVIGRLNRPITVVVSDDDRALRFSQRLAGDVPRLGNALVDNPQAQDTIRRYGLRVVDATSVKSTDSLNHSKFLDILPGLRQLALSDTGAKSTAVSRTGVFVVNAAGSILLSPLHLGQAVLGQDQ